TGVWVGYRDGVVHCVTRTAATDVTAFAHPAPGGATNAPPVARFTVSPANGRTTRTLLSFDASSTTDPEDDLSSLLFRWDFDGDGLWHPPFAAAPTQTRLSSPAGAGLVRLQVRDHLGLLGESTQSIDVVFEP